jgi:hypothetical protein
MQMHPVLEIFVFVISSLFILHIKGSCPSISSRFYFDILLSSSPTNVLSLEHLATNNSITVTTSSMIERRTWVNIQLDA